ncbi:hypothetical protein JHW33_00325 [Rahnella aceris]|uniref:putative zinc ribbon protein n=1 Tax=Rahnella sp. (strain Y9602) TaxID=2703885 RepID=UPI0019051DE4|nr:putative zinc ribbon protein [Rahnella aceris]QQN35136.1 hypothetical protein JHW33_00325 [Rahnella aceris]
MYAKSFIAFNSHGQLTAATKAQVVSGEDYLCHLCSSRLVVHAAENGKSPWFEHAQQPALAKSSHRLHDCPYVSPDAAELARVNTLRQFVPDARPLVHKGDWYCTKCRSDYHGEKYCTHCHTGIYSIESCPKPKDPCPTYSQ